MASSMTKSFEYAVLAAIPDPHRGERVNIGVVVFTDDGPDLRLPPVSSKIKSVTKEDWAPRLKWLHRVIGDVFEKDRKPSNIQERLRSIEPRILPISRGVFDATCKEEYEEIVRGIIGDLVTVPRIASAERPSSVKTEIAAALKAKNILSLQNPDINSGRVVRDFVIDKAGLCADFALKNGKLHVANVVDLRRPKDDVKGTALKALVLDQAKKNFAKQNVFAIGVYASLTPEEERVSKHVKLLKSYSEATYNWLNDSERNTFVEHLAEASHA